MTKTLVTGGLLLGGGLLLVRAVSGDKQAAATVKKAGEVVREAGGAARNVFSDEQMLRAVAPAEAQWLVASILAAGQRHDVSPYLLLAMASRESEFGRTLLMPDGRRGVTGPSTAAGTGDFAQRPWADYDPPPGGRGFGHGIWQIDWGSHRAFLESGNWTDIYRQADYVAQHWRWGANQLAKLGLSGDALVLAATAAFNAGLGNVRKNLAQPDSRTTHGNYGTDVTQRAARYMNDATRLLA